MSNHSSQFPPYPSMGVDVTLTLKDSQVIMALGQEWAQNDFPLPGDLSYQDVLDLFNKLKIPTPAGFDDMLLLYEQSIQNGNGMPSDVKEILIDILNQRQEWFEKEQYGPFMVKMGEKLYEAKHKVLWYPSNNVLETTLAQRILGVDGVSKLKCDKTLKPYEVVVAPMV